MRATMKLAWALLILSYVTLPPHPLAASSKSGSISQVAIGMISLASQLPHLLREPSGPTALYVVNAFHKLIVAEASPR